MAVKDELRAQVEAEVLGRPEVTQADMMGTKAYLVRNRMFAFWVADGLIVKLSDRTRQEFLDRFEGALFQGPQGRGQGEWTRLPIEKKADVEAAVSAAKAAYEYVRGAATAPAARSKARKKGRRR